MFQSFGAAARNTREVVCLAVLGSRHWGGALGAVNRFALDEHMVLIGAYR